MMRGDGTHVPTIVPGDTVESFHGGRPGIDYGRTYIVAVAEANEAGRGAWVADAARLLSHWIENVRLVLE